VDTSHPDPATALVVIDMLVGFCKHGNLYSPRYGPLISRLFAHLKRADELGAPIVFLADRHTPDDPEFRMFPPHCVAGSGEEDVVPELAGFVRRGTLVRKHTFSGFRGTDLDDVLARLAPARVEVAGVCTDICVLHTVFDLRMRGYEVVVRRDLVETYDAPGHDAEESNRFALGHIRAVLGATVE
jgi:nicotinamidase-related amidase